jgi:Tol biopolymer transport system component
VIGARPGRIALVAWLSAAILLPATTHAATRYDPRLRFKTISTPRFDVHYHDDLALARRLAVVAESVAKDLDGTLGPASGRVQVILVNQSDLANGWASPLPYNTIEIVMASPTGSSLIGYTDDWLRLVFVHEYTHIVHLSRGRGWIGGLRKVFGRMPLLYPNRFLPIWQIEGVATYEESLLTGQGRVPAGDFRSILDTAASASRLEPLDRASGGLVSWPSGHAPYVYGAYFHKYLAERYGVESLRALTDSTAGRLPYVGSPAFKRIFKRSLGDLWRDFESEAARATNVGGGSAPVVTRLTHEGFDVVGPRFGPDGRLYYSVVNPHGFPALLALSLGNSRPEKISDRYLGNRIGFAGSMLVFDQVELVRNVGLQSELYAVGLDGRGYTRLTRDARAADPDVSPDGQAIVCTRQRADRRELVTFVVQSNAPRVDAPETLVSEAGAQFASPRWSPDGRWIAAERGPSEIVLVDPVTRQLARTVATSARGRTIGPAWLPDGRLLFASDAEGGGFRLYRIDLTSLESDRLEGVVNATTPGVSRDGRTLVFVGYTPDGHDLFSLSLESADWNRVDKALFQTKRRDALVSEDRNPPLATKPERAYSPLGTIAPRAWTPTIESDREEIVIGAATATFDALGRHAYVAEVGWSASRGRPDWQVAYAYDRWWPTLFANVSDDTDPWRDGEVRTREANAGVLLPFRRVRWSQSLLGALHSSSDRFTCSECGVAGELTAVRRALRGGWLVDASRAYGFSISRESGWRTIATTELTREALGADGDAGAATFDLRGYLPVRPRHAVVAARFAAATSWGDDLVRRLFSASGSGPAPLVFQFDSDAVGLLRGLEEADVVGRHAAVVNVDYRLPLWRIERGAGTFPLFARTLHGALFTDVGHAWNARFDLQDVRASLGGELSCDAVLGYVLPITFSIGVAWVSQGRGAVAFGRIGHAF